MSTWITVEEFVAITKKGHAICSYSPPRSGNVVCGNPHVNDFSWSERRCMEHTGLVGKITQRVQDVR